MATVTEKPPVLSDAELVRAHQAGIWRYLRFLGCAEDRAADLVQETFLAVIRRPFEQRSERQTAAYLRRVARNVLLMSVRRTQRRPHQQQLEAAEAVWAELSPDGGDAYLDALDGCLESLAERSRRAIELRYRENHTRAEMAAALEMSEDGVKTLLRRARAALRECIERKVSE